MHVRLPRTLRTTVRKVARGGTTPRDYMAWAGGEGEEGWRPKSTSQLAKTQVSGANLQSRRQERRHS
jgi:hypothetical protein